MTIPISRPGLNFDAKWFCLRGLLLLWAGTSLLAGSTRASTVTSGGDLVIMEPLVLGSPTAGVATRTVTVTIAYKPTLVPGDANYTLMGCYGQPAGGNTFGKEGECTTPEGLPGDDFTIQDCLNGCADSKSSDDTEQYLYAGIKGGRECLCSTELSTDAPKLPDENCAVACPGDSRLSCGGEDVIVVYSLTGAETKKSAAAGVAVDKSNSDSNSGTPDADDDNEATPSPRKTVTDSPADETTTPSRATATSSSKEVSTGASKTAATTTDEKDPAPPPKDDGNSGSQRGRTVAAAVGGSMSGAVVLGALLFLGIRAYRRKRARQDAHVNLILEKQDNPNGETGGAGNKRMSGRNPPTLVLDNSHRDVRLTVDGVLVPTTPTLESGGGRRASTAAEADDSLFYALMGNIKHGGNGHQQQQQQPRQDAGHGQSSAVQWRGGGNDVVPPSPRVPFANHGSGGGFGGPASAVGVVMAGSMGSGPAPARPEHAAQPSAGLGERAWHRRKISTPFPPQPSPGPTRPFPTPHPQSSAARPPPSAPPLRSRFATAGPPSGLPNAPLPPTPPARPRRSFDTLDLTPFGDASTDSGAGTDVGFGRRSRGPNAPLPPPPRAPRGNSIYGNVAASASTPSLTASSPTYDSDNRDGNAQSQRATPIYPAGSGGFTPTPPLKVRRGQQGPQHLDREPTIPVLLPAPSGERLDSRRWRPAVEAGSREASPKSATTVGTSILDSPTVGRWAMR